MRLGPTFLSLVLLLALAPHLAGASVLPPGRAWSPATKLHHPAVAHFGSPMLLRDDSGRPAIAVSVRLHGETIDRWAVLAWRDSGWADSIWSQQLSGGFPPARALTTDGSFELLSITERSPFDWRLALWDFEGGVAAAETVAVTTNQGGPYAYSAAFTSGRRWVARIDQPVNQSFQVRTYVSDAPGVWQPVAPYGNDEVQCAIAPLDATSAVMVVNGFSNSPRWLRLRGTTWDPPRWLGRYIGAPRFFARPGGGWWMISTEGQGLSVDEWNGDGFTTVASLLALRDPGQGFLYVNWHTQSLETDQRPAIAWSESWGVGVNWYSVAHVAFPLTNGWSPGYRVAGADSVSLGPEVARDANGDVWLAWTVDRSPLERWVHSYVSATTSAPILAPQGTEIRIDWTLSEPAPQSRWTVLRDEGTGAFAPVATLTVASGTAMSWTDAAPPDAWPGPLRYRIRRETMDTRYAWESEIATAPGTAGVGPGAGGGRAIRLQALGNPVSASTTIAIHGAAPGPIEVIAFDAAGRHVARSQAIAEASGMVAVPLALGDRSAGVYLVVARDARGATSPALKLIRLVD
jgi:hypothetical protein